MEDNKNDKIAEQIELLVKLMKVESKVKNNITSDYTLAMFNKDEKEFITENYQNAEFAKMLINRFGEKGYFYEFDDKKCEWVKDTEGIVIKRKLNENEIKLIVKRAERIFEFFMVQPHMISILNRNQDKNFLVKLLGKDHEEEKPIQFGADDRSILQKIGDKIKGKQQEGDEDND